MRGSRGQELTSEGKHCPPAQIPPVGAGTGQPGKGGPHGDMGAAAFSVDLLDWLCLANLSGIAVSFRFSEAHLTNYP